MDAIEKRARELLLSHYCAAGFQQGDPLAASDANAVAVKAIATALTPPEGYVLVPVEPTEAMVLAAKRFQGDHDEVDHWMEWEGVAAANQYAAMLAARPEVPNDND